MSYQNNRNIKAWALALFLINNIACAMISIFDYNSPILNFLTSASAAEVRRPYKPPNKPRTEFRDSRNSQTLKQRFDLRSKPSDHSPSHYLDLLAKKDSRLLTPKFNLSARDRSKSSDSFRRKSVLDNARYAQKEYSPIFGNHKNNPFRGKHMNEVIADLRSGKIKPWQLKIDYVVRDGNKLILNTRSAHVLELAGIPRWQWNISNRTGKHKYEKRLDMQLQRSGLNSNGTLYSIRNKSWLKYP